MVEFGFDIDATLAAVTELRILHAPEPLFRDGPRLAGQLGIDNVMAVAEPPAPLLLTGALLVWAARRARWRCA